MKRNKLKKQLHYRNNKYQNKYLANLINTIQIINQSWLQRPQFSVTFLNEAYNIIKIARIICDKYNYFSDTQCSIVR